MPTYTNLDALILREDFEVQGDSQATPSQLSNTIDVSQLEEGSLFYQVIRKPDFQRETSNWEPEKISELIQSFLEGDLIPSVILWRSPRSGNIFVIDGAHRLSAFIAWVADDYGDGGFSTPFFQNFIAPEQLRAAEKTRGLIKQNVGSFIDLKTALKRPEFVPENRLRLAKNLSAFAINLQWVMGDAAKAENSFFKINQKATLIDPTELDMIKARHKPNALAARALIRAGTGHKYWSAFEKLIQEEIEAIARDVFEMLFKPAMETPIKTLDQPVAGRGYSADSVKMIFELVNFVNRVPSEVSKSATEKRGKQEIPDDATGSATLSFLRAVRKAASRIAGDGPASLGLHPFVYFYGATGRFQPTAFLAAVAFVQELEERNQFQFFTSHRCAFEEFLVAHRHFTNVIAREYGSLQRGLSPTLTMYRTILSFIAKGQNNDEITRSLQEQQQLRNLREITEEDKKYGRAFSRQTKNAIYIQQRMAQELRCKICGARLYFRATTVDHIERRKDGGSGTQENAQLTHPYCNTGYKESLAHSSPAKAAAKN